MNMIKKIPLIKAISASLVILIISVSAIGATYAWFVKNISDENAASGEMGKVDIKFKEENTGYWSIENTGTIDIIVRVRVILEQDTNSIPSGSSEDSYYNLLSVNVVNQNNWTKIKGNYAGGIFLIYGSGADFEGYEKVAPGKTIYLSCTTHSDYKVTIVPEALQATKNAYDYAWATQ